MRRRASRESQGLTLSQLFLQTVGLLPAFYQNCSRSVTAICFRFEQQNLTGRFLALVLVHSLRRAVDLPLLS